MATQAVLEGLTHLRLGGSASSQGFTTALSAHPDAVDSLKRLAVANADDSHQIDDEQLKQAVSTICEHMDKLCQIEDNDVKSLLQIVSLLQAHYEINDLIKMDMSLDTIDKILGLYLNVLDVFKHLGPSCNDRLLAKSSFITPLLITISFSFKLQYTQSGTLIKVLTLLFVFHLLHPHPLKETMKMFSINGSTNMDVFEVFNKLWEKTLEMPDTSMDMKHSPGPLSLVNRLQIMNDAPVSVSIVEQILPFAPHQTLATMAKRAVGIYSWLCSLSPTAKVADFLPLIEVLKTDLDSELLLCLSEALGMTDTFVKFHASKELRPVMEFLFFKLGSCVNTGKSKLHDVALAKVISDDISSAFQDSVYARYKMLFEVVDHNYKIDFMQDTQMAIALEACLVEINNTFDLMQDTGVLVEFGSIFSLDSLLNYTTFIIQKSLLTMVSPRREIPLRFTKTMSLKRFAPLPRSNFVSFSLVPSMSTQQFKGKNLARLVNSCHLSLEIMKKIINDTVQSKAFLSVQDELKADHLNVDYRGAHLMLEQYYTVLFTTLVLSYEMSTKAKVRTSNYGTACFFDYDSIANVLRMQVLSVFDELFQLYGSFAVFELVQFISEVSELDLELQGFSIVLLNHLVFHGKTQLKEMITENEMIKRPLVSYITKWDDGSASYTDLAQLLGIQTRKEFNLVQFERQRYLNLLGFMGVESPVNSSPTSNSSYNTGYGYNNYSTGYQQPDLTKKQSFDSVSTFSGGMNNTSSMTNLNMNYNNTMSSLGNASNNMLDHYKRSNVRNVQSFVPKQTVQPQQQTIPQYNTQPFNTQSQSYGFHNAMGFQQTTTVDNMDQTYGKMY